MCGRPVVLLVFLNSKNKIFSILLAMPNKGFEKVSMVLLTMYMTFYAKLEVHIRSRAKLAVHMSSGGHPPELYTWEK